MSEVTVETILQQIVQLPPTEQAKLRQLWEQEQQQTESADQPSKLPLDQRVPPKPVPDRTRELHWVAEHAHEYANQWIAIADNQVVAHGPDHDAVWHAVQASGIYLPLIMFVEDPNQPLQILWK